MDQLTHLELINWMALYIAAGSCCTIAFVLAATVTVIEVFRERQWKSVTSLGSAVLFLPLTWWRWQKLYLLSMPATLGVVVLFAVSINWR